MINEIRAFLLERGLVFAKRPAQFKAAMADILENAEADLTPMMRNLIHTLWPEWKMVEQQIEELGEELERVSAADAGCTRIRQAVCSAWQPQSRTKNSSAPDFSLRGDKGRRMVELAATFF